MAYDINDYRLVLSQDYKTLTVEDRSSSEVQETFALAETPVRIEIIDDGYHLEENDLQDPAHDQGFDVSTGSENFAFDYNGDRTAAGGFGIIDIRDINAVSGVSQVAANLTYHLMSCPIAIRYESGIPKNFRLKTSCPCEGCLEPDGECRTIEIVE